MRVIPVLFALAIAASSLLMGTSVRAERPVAAKLLPDQTLVYVQARSVPDLIEAFSETAMGRITSDEKIRPFVAHLYGSALEAYTQIEERIGLPLAELLRIPQGELCIAVVAKEQGSPEGVLLFDVGNHAAQAQTLLKRLDEELLAAETSRTVEKVGDVQLDVYEFPGRRRRLVVFEKDNTVVFTSNADLSKQLLDVWGGNEELLTLSENRKFKTIMSRCGGDDDEQPHVTFYADPFALAQRITRGNFGGQAALATAAGLGIDGINGIGGSMVFATDEFDGVMHAHILLESPREGVVKMIALDSGDTTPEPWVPTDVASYSTLYWDIDQTLDELTKLYEVFRGEDTWQLEIVDRISEQLDIDFETEILQQIAGRATMIAWMEPPARLNSQATLIAIKVKDPQKAKRSLQRVADKLGNALTKETYGTVTFYRTPIPNRNASSAGQLTRVPDPCLAVIGDYLMGTDSSKLLQQVIVTKSDSSESLANDIEYKLIASKIKRQVGTAKTGMITFRRPEEGFRALYELATSKSVREQLDTRSDNNPFFRALNGALKENPLPPFAVVAQYLAPGGGMVVNDATGFHYTAFTLRRD
ncbi:MAG: DUF3352 domain-containing protein [Pirellulaceae bacterium]|nr:DUF3352 domain-containing protein [Pirellulaceae bacterium]